MDQIQKGDRTEEELMIIIAHKDQGQLDSSRGNLAPPHSSKRRRSR